MDFNFGITADKYLSVGNTIWSVVQTNEVYVEDRWYMVTGVYDQVTAQVKYILMGC